MNSLRDTWVVNIKDSDGHLEYEADAPDPLAALRTVVRAAMRDGWKAKNLTSFSVTVNKAHRHNDPKKKWWRP